MLFPWMLVKRKTSSISSIGNEAGTVHKSREGVPTTAIGLAVRNLHSGAEIVSQNDMNAAAALLSACLEM